MSENSNKNEELQQNVKNFHFFTIIEKILEFNVYP
jgi:hypothetical protein